MKCILGILLITSAVFAHAEDLSICKSGWDTLQGGNYEKSISLFNECIKKGNLTNPSLAQTYRNIGIAYKRNNNCVTAIPYFKRSLISNKEDPWYDHINIGNCYALLKNYDSAIKQYEEALELKPKDYVALYNKGETYEFQGKKDLALKEYEKAFNYGDKSQELILKLTSLGSSLVKMDLPQPPNGFSWAKALEIKGAFLKPEGWFFHHQKQGDSLGYFITKENLGITGDFRTGTTINVVPHIQKKTGYIASDYAKSYIGEVTKGGGVVKDPWEHSMGPFKSFGVVTSNADPKGGDYITHHLTIANDTTQTMYLIIFEAPSNEWDKAWKVGEKILGKLYIDSDI